MMSNCLTKLFGGPQALTRCGVDMGVAVDGGGEHDRRGKFAILRETCYPGRTTGEFQIHCSTDKAYGLWTGRFNSQSIPPFLRMKSVAIQLILAFLRLTRKRKEIALPGWWKAVRHDFWTVL